MYAAFGLPSMTAMRDTWHGSAVCVGGQGVLILGTSGSGKSSLALQLIALGAKLVADDQVLLRRQDDVVMLSKPSGLPAKIEARGVGLLDAPLCEKARLGLIVDLEVRETQRMPELRTREVMGIPVTIWRCVAAAHFPAAILLYLRSHAAGSGEES